MDKQKKRVIITGGAGFLGSHVSREFLDNGVDVTVLDYFHQYIYPLSNTFLANMQYRFNVLLKGAEVLRSNINNKEDLRRRIATAQPDYIVHLAALPLANVALWQTEEAFDGIVNATFNILDAASEAKNLKKFVYISSSMVFGDFTQIPMPEDGRKDPKDIYGGMKLAGEILVRTFCKRLKVPCIIIRPSALYGPTDNNRRVLQAFVENAIAGKPLEVTNPEATFLDFTYVEDGAKGIRLATLADNVINEDFNITRGEGRSLAEAIKILRTLFASLNVVEKKVSDPFRPARGALDVSKARKMLGYDPTVSLEEGLEKYVQFVRQVSLAAPQGVMP